MQNTKILPVAAFALAMSTLGINRGFGTVKDAKPHLLPVETFSRQIGNWNASGEDRTMSPEVREKLPHSHILDRTYQDTEGHSVNLTVVTSSEYSEFHDPNLCFPSQGWGLSDQHAMRVGAQDANAMVATQGSEQLTVLYWLTGEDYRAYIPNGRTGRKYYTLRSLLGYQEHPTLFVRLTTPQNAENNRALLEFARQIQTPLRQLLAMKR